MEIDGKNGAKIELLDDMLVIRRYGVGSFFNHGLKGEKRIPYASITIVQIKEPGLTTGYIQFGVAGGNESRGGVRGALHDENTVLFRKKVREDFRKVRDIVEQRAAAARGGGKPASISLADELGKFAALRDAGVLTDAEFAEQKAKLLG